MIGKAQLDAFLSCKNIAVVGVSRNQKKFSFMVYSALLNKGYHCIPVNPNLTEMEDQKCYPSLSSIKEPFDACVILTAKKNTDVIFIEAKELGIPHIWVQFMSETPLVKESANTANQNIIFGKCMLMFLDPVVGAHKLHRFFNKLMGKYPV